jgi:hypothetical protein
MIILGNQMILRDYLIDRMTKSVASPVCGGMPIQAAIDSQNDSQHHVYGEILTPYQGMT